ITRARRRVDIEARGAGRRRCSLRTFENLAAYALPLQLRRDSDPIEVVPPVGAWDRTVAGIGDNPALALSEEESIAALRPLLHTLVCQLGRNLHFLLVEEAGRGDEPADRITVAG